MAMFDPNLAVTRFGYGFSPRVSAPASLSEIKVLLAGPDTMAQQYPIARYDDATPASEHFPLQQAVRRAEEGSQQRANRKRRLDAWVENAHEERRTYMVQHYLRLIRTQDALRERLVAFWTDHFSISIRHGHFRYLQMPLVEQAIRPHVTGRFVDMLKAVTLNPEMLDYLGQGRSYGPNSEIGRSDNVGLNENLARELLELHTLGVGGAYSQTDVRQLAELLTGLLYRRAWGFKYEWRAAEPGSETVLGKTYSGRDGWADIQQVLDDLAAHPTTALHIARKLVVHFVSSDPDQGLVENLAAVFRDTGGNLLAVTTAMLDDPRSWVPERTKIRPPQEFVAAGLRALNVSERDLRAMTMRDYNRTLLSPARRMGQQFMQPSGPDGFSEDAAHWLTPQFMAARIRWAMSMPERLKSRLPDPRSFVNTTLGGLASEDIYFVASAAQNRAEGVGLVLASPAFQRR